MNINDLTVGQLKELQSESWYEGICNHGDCSGYGGVL